MDVFREPMVWSSLASFLRHRWEEMGEAAGAGVRPAAKLC